MRALLSRVAVGLYLVWLLLVVLLVLGRFTPVPLVRFARPGVVAGALVLTVVGAGRLARSGYRWVVD